METVTFKGGTLVLYSEEAKKLYSELTSNGILWEHLSMLLEKDAKGVSLEAKELSETTATLKNLVNGLLNAGRIGVINPGPPTSHGVEGTQEVTDKPPETTITTVESRTVLTGGAKGFKNKLKKASAMRGEG